MTSVKNGTARIALFRSTDAMVEVLPGEWDVENPDKPSLADVANKYLEENGYQLHGQPDYKVMPVMQSPDGKKRMYQSTLCIYYLPKEIVKNGQEEVPREVEEAAQLQAIASTPGVQIGGAPAGERISEVHRIVAELRKTGIIATAGEPGGKPAGGE